MAASRCSATDSSRPKKKLEREGLILRLPHSMQHWAKYYLTERGKQITDQLVTRVPAQQLQSLEKNAGLAAAMGFGALLEYVYRAAPEFAVNSVARTATDTGS